MRLHHLEVTAFGPFADTVVLDLDRVAEAGLFLLSGPTGAGKTSVLDAVCFALYGDVPGDRSEARRLRCDLAAPGAAPRVVLECTLAGRRFRIVRSPAWQRPKKRGTGLTTEQASVVVSELRDGEWVALSTRLDEAGDLLGGLLGMNLPQFTQVAMLPQGRFQAFLRAKTDERHALLQRLFRTGRFEDVERWLRERRVRLHRRSEELLQELAVLTGRLCEAADADLPEGCDLADLAGPAEDGALLTWAHDLRARAAATLAGATETVAAAAEQEAARRADLDTARAQADDAAAVEAALAERHALTAAADEVEALVARLDLGRRAAALHAHLGLVARADRAAHLAATLAAERAAALGLAGATDLARRRGEVHDDLAAVRAALPAHRSLVACERDLADLAREGEQHRRRAAAAEQAGAALPAEVAEAVALLDAALAAQARHDGVLAALDAVRVQRAARAELVVLEARLVEAREHHLAAREQALAAGEALLAIRESRVAGMAAELAGALASGGCCPVCGSHEHPAKAAAAPGAADAETERSAQHALDDAKAEEHLRDTAVRDLELQRVALLARAGSGSDADSDADSDAEAETRETTLAAEVAVLAGEVAALPDRRRAVEDLRRREAETARALADARAGLAAVEARTQARTEEHTRLHDALAEVLGRLADRSGKASPDTESDTQSHAQPDTLPQHEARLTRLLSDLEQALDAERDALARAAEAADALAHAEEAAQEAGFEGLESARDAVLEPAELARLEERAAEHRRRVERVEAVLAELTDDPDLAAGAAASAARRAAIAAVPAARTRHREALDALGAAREAAHLATTRCGRVLDLLAGLEPLLDTWRPVRRDHERTARLAAFVEGKAPENRLQMRLSAYVLAYRLAQVVAAANERLGRMTDERYRLEHTAERGSRDPRGGLGLVVRDDWSGEAREPSTLSGGETFVVSLALALGLADVIAHEVGGAAIDTLFVDEGFGSLDPETLDDVLDVLDGLREGGRVVGVVSHVTEMRDRIPTQIVVAKGRAGSTASIRVGAAG